MIDAPESVVVIVVNNYVTDCSASGYNSDFYSVWFGTYNVGRMRGDSFKVANSAGVIAVDPNRPDLIDRTCSLFPVRTTKSNLKVWTLAIIFVVETPKSKVYVDVSIGVDARCSSSCFDSNWR